MGRGRRTTGDAADGFNAVMGGARRGVDAVTALQREAAEASADLAIKKHERDVALAQADYAVLYAEGVRLERVLAATANQDDADVLREQHVAVMAGLIEADVALEALGATPAPFED